ncbi:metal-dependent transcriptional regulator [Arthrobacter sp. H5]|uniref:metal-dependent transcriptional regulator n=1 Tax=Arthrobacter sp. H5 TaxID=1267973 RepID=UPI000485E001|nr:metal-dependent transcriptional regulator [Arthrobacter sp. H5]
MARRTTALGTDSSSVQDYVKVIYAFTEWQDRPITASQVAARLSVANSSASEMIRKLVDLGLVHHEPYGSVELTPEGLQLALAMVRRHRLLETFLVRELGYSWDEVHDEAELLEHTVSDTFIDRLDAKLGQPLLDPHGDPIPSAAGTINVPNAHSMRELDSGHTGRIARISDDNPDLLRFLTGEDIGLGEQVEVLGRKPFGGPLTVRLGEGPGLRELDFGDELTGALWIESVGSHPGCSLVQ